MGKDVDFSSMSTEDLETYIEQANAKISDVPATEVVVEAVEEKVIVEPEKAEQQETVEPSKPVDPFDSKTPEQLKEMVKNQNIFISQQGNQIGKLTKQLMESANKPAETPQYDKYSPEDIETIRNIIRDESTKAQTAQQEEAARSHARNIAQNQAVWVRLERDPDKISFVAPMLNSRYLALGKDESERVNVLETNPNWVQDQVDDILFGTVLTKKEKAELEQKSKDTVHDRKLAATTITGVAPAVKEQKAVSKMTAAEYLEYCKANGLNLSRS